MKSQVSGVLWLCRLEYMTHGKEDKRSNDGADIYDENCSLQINCLVLFKHACDPSRILEKATVWVSRDSMLGLTLDPVKAGSTLCCKEVSKHDNSFIIYEVVIDLSQSCCVTEAVVSMPGQKIENFKQGPLKAAAFSLKIWSLTPWCISIYQKQTVCFFL